VIELEERRVCPEPRLLEILGAVLEDDESIQTMAWQFGIVCS
jgi:hypothetical protein